jgi:pimeloyl-ACP methyl ester carboxylesterase
MSFSEVTAGFDGKGSGPVVLVLHGGGGPVTVAPLVAQFGKTMRTLAPTLPGWNGTERPASMTRADDFAMFYLRELERGGLRDVTVVGSSLGGWIAAEMAVRDPAGLIGRIVLVDAVGVEVPGETVVDFFALTPRGVAEHSYHDPDRFFLDPATLPPERLALIRGNLATLRVIAGERMYDPELLGRLGQVKIPALVLWGESDRIAGPGYGRALAAALPNGRFELIAKAGHLPQIEQPEATFAAIEGFVAAAG